MKMNRLVPPHPAKPQLVLISNKDGTQYAEGGISVTCYLHQIPSFVEPELKRLYGSLYSSLDYLRVYGTSEQIHTYVAGNANEITSIFLFEQRNDEVRVINEVITLNNQELVRFSEYVFLHFQSANKILFHAVKTGSGPLSLPHQRLHYTDDIVLMLPKTEEAYIASLGKATRKNIKHHLSRAKRTYPSFQHEVHIGEEAREEDIRAIVAFNHARMAEKNKISLLNDEEADRIIQLVKRCGLVSVIRIDGRVCAGTICFEVDGNYFSSVNAHDPRYNDFRLGTICCYLTILDCIKRSGKEFHFLWGRYEYKYALLGAQTDLDDLRIYRSRFHLMRDSGALARNAVKSWVQQYKLALLEKSKAGHPLMRKAVKLLSALRG